MNVTDGTLTLGVRNAHAIYNDYEWACIGNLKLTYLGTMEEAAERMDGTITNMCERANSIINSTFNENDCRIYPNYSKALKQKLADMMDVWDNATAGMLDRTNGEIAQAALGRWKRVSRIVTP